MSFPRSYKWSKVNDARLFLARVVALLSGVLIAAAGWGATPPDTVIANTAALDYVDMSGNSRKAASNTVEVVTRIVRTRAVVDFVRVNPAAPDRMARPGEGQCDAGAGYTALPPPRLSDGTELDMSAEQPLSSTEYFHGGEAFFVSLHDPDQNLDPAVAEAVEVLIEVAATGDLESVRLGELEPDSGEFVGYIPTTRGAATRRDCMLQVAPNSRISVNYVDPSDPDDLSSDEALVDPLGLVFDSATGAPVDGAIVRLVDLATGLPALVIGDDGVSEFPAELVSGGVATDSGGTDYDFEPGQYRFPLVNPGQYRLDVTAPAGYSSPSTVAVIDLQGLPGGPFALGPASFGEPFMIDPGPALRVDLPLDAVATAMFLQKTTTTAVASLGDFVKFTLDLDNVDSDAPVQDIVIEDVLPPGVLYVPGSARIDGLPAADPVISPDRRRLTFAVGDLLPAAGVQVDYVTEIATGSRGPALVNTAVARAAGRAESNVATASVRLAEALFRSRSTVIGRVIDGSCDDDTGNDLDGVGGVRLFLADGRYAVSDEGGRYHFEGLQPGTHVVQLDVDTVPDGYEIVPCERNARFSGRAYSQFVSLRPGALWRADFHLRAIPVATGEIALRLSSAMAGGDIVYTLTVQGSGAPVTNVRPMVMLPAGIYYAPGSTRVDGTRAEDPAQSGQLLTFALPAAGGEAWSHAIEFRSLPDASAGEYVTKALVSFDSAGTARQRTPLAENVLLREPPATERVDFVFTTQFDTRRAELKPRDRARIGEALAGFADASDVRVVVTGHTDAVPIAPQNRAEFADNKMLSRARAQAVATFLREALDLAPAQLSVQGLGADQPVATNATAAGRARNRRVEVQVWGERPVAPGALRIARGASAPVRVTLEPVAATPEATAQPDAPDPMDLYAEPDWIERLTPGAGIELPPVGYNPPIPSLRVAVRHLPRQTVELRLDGEPVSALSFDGKQTNAAKTVVLSRWRGIDLADNDNELTVIVRNADGSVASTQTRIVHYAGAPVRAEIDREKSTLAADGRTRPMIAVRLYDRWGKPARPDAVGSYRVDPPYRAWWEVETLRDNPLLAVGNREPVYRVGPDGLAYIELEPTSRTGEVTINMIYADEREQPLRAWLEPAARDWILVGFAEGTAGYNTLTNNQSSARDAGFEDEFYTDGKIAFYAKGRIRGDFLLTLAYDSDRDEDAARERLHGTIDPERFYTLYGDATEQRFDAATQDEIFLRLERGQFYALFGDFDTGLDVTELTRYQRSFNGLHSEYQGERFGLNVFAARTDNAFVKDELRGDGTSGLYRLSQVPIVINSEKVTIETRDRFSSEVILSSRSLTRHLDYDIDYLAGTLFFKQPVRHRDDGFNPVWIVVDYESRDPGERSTTAGGRATVRLADGRLELGASAIDEGTSGAGGELAGVDLRLRLGAATELRAEYATSDTRTGGVEVEGDAAIAELTHTSGRLDGRVYYRELDTGFGLGQQRGAESGLRKMGFDGRLRFSERLSLNAESYRHDNLASDARREVIQGEMRWQGAGKTAGIGLRAATDEQVDGRESESTQLFVNGSVKTLDNRLTLRASAETDLGDNANIAYPQRTLLGLDYQLGEAVSLYAEHERASGEQIDAQLTRMGVRATPWERAQLHSGITQQMTEHGPRVFANVGLVQGWQVNERWALDAGLDHSNTITAPGVEAFNPDAGFVTGDPGGDFLSVFLGTLYRHENWTVNTRAEYRNADTERRVGLLGGFYREQRQGRGFSAALELFDTERASGADLRNADLRLSWAYRPVEARWVFLDRLDLRYEDLDAPGSAQESWRIVNNLHANWLINRRNQLGLQYGVKFVRSDIDGRGYNGFTDLVGVDFRRDLAERWDLGLQASLLHSWNSDVIDYSVGADVGYAFARNVWLSLGYNFAGFDDEDFSEARYTARGPYIRFRIKADQDNLSQRDFFARENDTP